MRFGYVAHAHRRGAPELVCGMVIADVPATDRGIHVIVHDDDVTCEGCREKLTAEENTANG